MSAFHPPQARFPYDPVSGLYVGGEAFGVSAAVPPRPSRAQLEALIRFEHARKRLAVTEFAGAALLTEGAEANLYLTDVATLRSIRAAQRAQARAPGDALPCGLAAAWSLAPGDVVVALGDSITDDALSWAEILRGPLERDGVVLVNAGLSGDTTADALRRLYGITALAPALVITLLGTNDAQRHGPAPAKPLLAASESAANLAAIRTWLRDTGARTAWITPPPVDEAALAAVIAPRPFALHAADVRAIADAVHAFPDPVLDTWAVLGDPPEPGVLEPDGVHPSAAGQSRIALALTAELVAVARHAAAVRSPRRLPGAS